MQTVILVSFLPAGARPVRPRDKISDLPNPEPNQLPPVSSYLGGITYNCKQPCSVLTGGQYQTCFPNKPPRSNKGVAVGVMTRGDFSGYWRGSSERSSEDLLSLERNSTPTMLRTQLSKVKVQLHKRCR
jgi:hypothetical protein